MRKMLLAISMAAAVSVVGLPQQASAYECWYHGFRYVFNTTWIKKSCVMFYGGVVYDLTWRPTSEMWMRD